MRTDNRLRRKVRNSYLVSTISLTLVLFLLGSVGYLLTVAKQAADSLQKNITVSVELKKRTDENQRQKIEKQLKSDKMVASLRFVSKDDKAQDAQFRQLFDSEFEEVLEDNPLLDSYELTLVTPDADQKQLDALVSRLNKIDGVDRAYYPVQLAEQLHGTIGKIRLVLLLFGGALLLISLILMSNTIRLAIYAKRYLINTMKLVGATKWFIMRPFLRDSLTQGAIAGACASLLFCLAIYGLNGRIPELTGMAQGGRIGGILLVMIIGGMVISCLFTFASLNKFINIKSNKIDLY